MAEERKYLNNMEVAYRMAVNFLELALQTKIGPNDKEWTPERQQSHDEHMQEHLDTIKAAYARVPNVTDWEAEEVGALTCSLSHMGDALNGVFTLALGTALAKGAAVIGPDTILERIDEDEEVKH